MHDYEIDFEILKASMSAVTFDNEEDALVFFRAYVEKFPEKQGTWTEKNLRSRFYGDVHFTLNPCLSPYCGGNLRHSDRSWYEEEGFDIYRFDEICMVKEYDCDMSDGILDVLF